MIIAPHGVKKELPLFVVLRSRKPQTCCDLAIQYCLALQPDLNAICHDHYTPLHIAISFKDEKAILYLLRARANPYLLNSHKDNCFDLAIRSGIDLKTMVEKTEKRQQKYEGEWLAEIGGLFNESELANSIMIEFLPVQQPIPNTPDEQEEMR